MNMPKHDDGNWPECIYYVCNSGSGIVVNATPLVHAGADRVAGMMILCGVRDPNSPTSAELRESIHPAQRLTSFARQLGIRNIHGPVYGAPDSCAAWAGVLNDAAKYATDLDATLVYNVTGGPRTVPLAALLGASNAIRASMVALAVSFNERACTRLAFSAEGQFTGERTLPARGRVGFDGLIALYGYQEQDRDARRRHEAFVCKHRPVADQVRAETTRRGGKASIAALHWAMQFSSQGRERGESATPFHVAIGDLRAPPWALRRVVDAFRGLDGLNIVRNPVGNPANINSLEVRTEMAHRFIAGIWLEAVVYGLVCDVFRNTSRAEVVAGAVLAVAGRPPPPSNVLPDDTEIDVAVVIDDQLHVVEVKAVTSSRRLGDHIAKLVKIRQELGSQVMRAFLVAPLLSRSELERGGFIARAEKQGVRLLYGQRALELLQRELRTLR